MIYASLKSIASYVPSKTLSNFDLEKMVQTNDEWITQRTGIKERRIADKNEHTSDLGLKAAKLAIKRAGLKKEEIDGIICATLSPDYLTMPSTACVIASKLGISNVLSFDISAACSGFIYLLKIAKSLVISQECKNILIIGAEKISSFVDYHDRSTCILFGDGAGAAIVGQTQNKNLSIIDVNASSDGKYSDLLITPGGGCVNPSSSEMISKKLNYIKMSGNEVFKVAVKTLTSTTNDILEKHNLSSNDIDFLIPHQANLRIIEAVRQKLNFPKEKTIYTVQKYGNTSAASIPMAINDAYEQNKLTKGSLILLAAFGGGFTWGSALLHFNA